MATPGYIPYGLDRSSRLLDDISSARSKLRNARIREATAGGDAISVAISDTIDTAGAARSAIENRAAASAAIKSEKEAARRKAIIKRDQAAEQLKVYDQAFKNMSPNARLPYMDSYLSIQSELAGYQQAVDSYGALNIEKVKAEANQSIFDKLMASLPEAPDNIPDPFAKTKEPMDIVAETERLFKERRPANPESNKFVGEDKGYKALGEASNSLIMRKGK
jgi:hypothetical protein